MNQNSIEWLKAAKDKLKTLPIKIKATLIFGSWARNEKTPNSDIDLLIISDQIAHKRHRRGREIALIKGWFSLGLPFDILLLTTEECISNFKNHNPLFLDIACEGLIIIDEDNFLKNIMEETKSYISDKKLEKLSDGWRFPVLYRKATYLSHVSNKDFAKAMFCDGERDFIVGSKIIEYGFFDKAVYNFQQAIEKSIKSVLISFGEFKKTHFVGSILMQKLKEVELENEWKERLIDIANLSEEIEAEVTWSRYPGIDDGKLWIPSEEYTLDDAKEIKEKCKQVIDIGRAFFEWWFQNK